MQIMNVKQCAEYLGYSQNHLRKLAKEGAIPCRRPACSASKQAPYKFIKEKIDAWMMQDLPRVDARRTA